MEKVSTQTFSVPLAEVPTMYKGGFTSVALAKPSYAPGESIRMILEVWTWRSAQWFDIVWHSTIIAYNAAGLKLTQVSATHVAVPGVDDYETYDVDIDLGKQPAAGLSGRLELWCDGSPAVMVATASFNVLKPGELPPGVPPEEEEKKVPWGAIAGIGAAVIVLAAISQRKA